VESQPTARDESARAIDARNAFIMDSLLSEVMRSGTGAKSGELKRADLYGKTGTTNDSIDTWFAGFQPTLAAVVWMGYDTPRKLGDHETGGGLSLPIWISYMRTALNGVPITEPSAPEGVVNVGGEWYYDEYVKSGGVTSLGLTDKDSTPENPGSETQALPPADEKKRILDLFKN
jgi:penicillin-binding protein 1A